MGDVAVECRVTPRGMSFPVRVKPRSSRNEISGVREGALSLSVTAPPVEGAANRACVALLAEAFGVNRRQVRILSGEKSRTKLVEIEGVGMEDFRRLLRGLLRVEGAGEDGRRLQDS